MTLGQWIKNFAEENDIDIPSGIDEQNTTLNFLLLAIKSGFESDENNDNE